MALDPTNFRAMFPEFNRIGVVGTHLAEDYPVGQPYIVVRSAALLKVGAIIHFEGSQNLMVVRLANDSVHIAWSGVLAAAPKGTPVFQDGTVTDANILTAGAEADALWPYGDSHFAGAYLQAHILAVREQETAQPDGGAGLVTREEVGDSQFEYQTGAANARDVWYGQTAYGRKFLQFRRRSSSYVMGGAMVS